MDEAGSQGARLEDDDQDDAGSQPEDVANPDPVTLNLGPKFEEVAGVSVSWLPVILQFFSRDSGICSWVFECRPVYRFGS